MFQLIKALKNYKNLKKNMKILKDNGFKFEKREFLWHATKSLSYCISLDQAIDRTQEEILDQIKYYKRVHSAF